MPNSRLILAALTLPLYSALLYGQETQPEGQPPDADLHAPTVASDALIWKALETHGKVTLQIAGKDINLKKHFEQGESPSFNALKEGLKPGIYSYRIEFVPNRIQEDQNNLAGILDQRRKLLALREVALETGEAEEAKRLYAEANKLRASAGELMNEQKETEYKFYEKSGQIVVDKSGSVKVFNRQQQLKKLDEERRKRKALTPPERKEEEELRKTEI